jgi:hypothetical protein
MRTTYSIDIPLADADPDEDDEVRTVTVSMEVGGTKVRLQQGYFSATVVEVAHLQAALEELIARVRDE